MNPISGTISKARIPAKIEDRLDKSLFEYDIAETEYAYPGFTIHLMLLAAEIERGAPELIEHTALRWVTAEEAQGMELCPADRILLDRIMEDRDGISE